MVQIRRSSGLTLVHSREPNLLVTEPLPRDFQRECIAGRQTESKRNAKEFPRARVGEKSSCFRRVSTIRRHSGPPPVMAQQSGLMPGGSRERHTVATGPLRPWVNSSIANANSTRRDWSPFPLDRKGSRSWDSELAELSFPAYSLGLLNRPKRIGPLAVLMLRPFGGPSARSKAG